MVLYSDAEKIEMILIYGEAGRNSVQASQLYAERHPERNHPSRQSFDRLIQLFSETGSIKSLSRKRSQPVTDEDAEMFVLATVNIDPTTSCRKMARTSNISKSSVHRILRHKFHPFHISLHQKLDGNDFENRVAFCTWALQQIQRNRNFVYDILFTDEATFTNRGQLDTHNMHYWCTENPRWFRQVEHQRPWNVNVWCGILGDSIIGPFFIDGTLNGNKYGDFLTNELPNLLENVSLLQRNRMIFQHDGCPAHNALIARQVPHQKFPQRWIGRGADIRWPARSSDLTPLDFFLWGAVKSEVYNDIPTTPEDMRERIITACHNISEEVIRKARQSFINRLQKCVEVTGHHFEHLLQ